MLEALRKQLRELMNDLADDVSTGSAQDYAGYQRLVGKIEGLATAERLLLDILSRLEDLDRGDA